MSIGAALALSALLLTVFGTIDGLWKSCGVSMRLAAAVETALLIGALAPVLEAGEIRWVPGPLLAVPAALALLMRRQRPGTTMTAVAVGAAEGALLFAGTVCIPGALEQTPLPQAVWLGLLCGLVPAAVLRSVRGAGVASLTSVLVSDMAMCVWDWSVGGERLLLGHVGLADEAVTALAASTAAAWLADWAWRALSMRLRVRQAR